jgi:acyl-CoA synthetase (AMP-forming)/AMP-acid ligase II
VLCAGAAVPADLWEQSREFLPNGRLHSPYGATEALPVATIASDEMATVAGRGACVGRPVPGVEVRIIAPTDGPLASWAEARELATGEIGEIVVSGPTVTKAYDALPEATAWAKIPDGGVVWHRMGDCGYRDAAGWLWFCGRKAERVATTAGVLHTEPCEQVFRAHPAARRCALIGLGEPGRQIPALVVECVERDPARRQALAAELAALGGAHPHTAGITRFFFRERLPVDVRHNAKIHRLTLARWAATAPWFDAAGHP